MQRARNRGDDTAEATLSNAWGSTRGGTVTTAILPEMMLVGVGGMFLGYATWRYFQVQAALLVGQFPVNRVGVRVRAPPFCGHIQNCSTATAITGEAEADDNHLSIATACLHAYLSTSLICHSRAGWQAVVVSSSLVTLTGLALVLKQH